MYISARHDNSACLKSIADQYLKYTEIELYTKYNNGTLTKEYIYQITSAFTNSVIDKFLIEVDRMSFEQKIEEILIDNAYLLNKLGYLKTFLCDLIYDKKYQIAEDLLMKLHKNLSSKNIEYLINKFIQNKELQIAENISDKLFVESNNFEGHCFNLHHQNLPAGYAITKHLTHNYYQYIFASKTMLHLTGRDHNGALVAPKKRVFWKKGYDIIDINLRKDTGGSTKILLGDILNEYALDTIGLVTLDFHGVYDVNAKEHFIDYRLSTLKTSTLIQKIVDVLQLKTPINFVLTGCHGEKALSKSIKIITPGSTILSYSEYREENGKKIIKSNTNKLSYYSADELIKSHLDTTTGIDLLDLALFRTKSYLELGRQSKPSPAFAHKTKKRDNNVFSCIETAKEIVDSFLSRKIVNGETHLLSESHTQNFINRFCGEDSKCIKETEKVLHLINNEEQYIEIDAGNFDYPIYMALGCYVGYIKMQQEDIF